VDISSRRNPGERRIEELLARLHEGDVLLVAELSRLGRNMFEAINLINQLNANGVQLIFVRQPELSTAGPHGKLLKIPLRRIRLLLNPQLAAPISYPAYRYFVRQDPELLDLWQSQRA
jgi:hypothetical protein